MTSKPACWIFAAIFIMFSCPAISLAASLVPDTGQNTCYDDYYETGYPSAANIFNPCPSPGDDFYGQDTCYTINLPSYTKLDANGNILPDSATEWTMVKDNVTGLIWEVKTDDGSIHDKDYFWSWSAGSVNGPQQGSRTTFLNQLNSDNFGGYSDWRMPTLQELYYLISTSRYEPTIDTYYFPNTLPNEYLTSKGYKPVFFEKGTLSTASWALDNPSSIRAVRGAQSSPSFTDNGDDTITDNNSGLMWLQHIADTNDNGGIDLEDTLTWKDALAWCENLSFAGYDDWRMPNIKELFSIIDQNRDDPGPDVWGFKS